MYTGTYTADQIDELIVGYLRKMRPERHIAVKVIAGWFTYYQAKTNGSVTSIQVWPDPTSRDKFFVSYYMISNMKVYERNYDVTNPRTEAEEQLIDPIKAYNRAMRGVI